LSGTEKLKRPNLALRSFKKAKFFSKFSFKCRDSKLEISQNIASIDQIYTKQALKYTIFFNSQKSPKMAK